MTKPPPTDPALRARRALLTPTAIVALGTFVLGGCAGDDDGEGGMSTGGVVVVIVLAAALITALLLVWNSKQRAPAPPERQRRDLDDRIDQVVNGAPAVSDRAVSVAATSDEASIASSWPPVRTDMLALEGDIVTLNGHVGEGPLGLSLGELDRAVHALRDAVQRHLELRATDPSVEHELGLSQQTVAARRQDVDTAVGNVQTTRP